MQLRSQFTTRAELRVNMDFIFDRALGFPVGLVEPGACMFLEPFALSAEFSVVLCSKVNLICEINSGRGNVIRHYCLLL